MDPESSGAYLTGAIHISSAVWKPSNWAKATAPGIKPLGPPKIVAQDVKARVLEALIIHMEIIKQAGMTMLNGQRDQRHGSILANSDRMAEAVVDELCKALDGLDEEMDQSHKMLVKNGVMVGSWKGKGKKLGVGG